MQRTDCDELRRSCNRALTLAISWGMIAHNWNQMNTNPLLVGLAFVFLFSSVCAAAQSAPNLQIHHETIKLNRKWTDAEFGSFSVPENYQVPQGKRITLAFVRLKATMPHSGAPILYLAGGPGTSGIDYVTSERFAPFLYLRKFGDIIALDQRGTGRSQPNLTCPTVFQYPTDEEATEPKLARAYAAFAASCSGYWKHKEVDLSAYNTVENATDVAALSQALHIKKFRLFGASYGSHLALAIIRYHPEIVQRAVIGAIEGPDQTIKLPANADSQLAKVSRLIAADPRAGKLLRDFQASVVSLIKQLEEQPRVVALGRQEGASSQAPILRLSGMDVRLLTAALLGNRDDIESIPKVFGPIANGNYGAIATIVATDIRKQRVSAMSAAMDCASGTSQARWKLIEQQKATSMLGTAMDFPLPEWCSAWGVPELPESFRDPIETSVPTLFIAGTLDGQTPVENANEVRRGFVHGLLFVVNGAGHDHSLFLSSPTLINAISEFFVRGRGTDSVFQTQPLHFDLPTSRR
jgi:pimeloyl-ACP methyl ester carboxylesterase